MHAAASFTTAPTPHGSSQERSSHAVPILSPLRFTDYEEPLYLVHGIGGGMDWGYENLTRHLPRRRPVIGFRCRSQRGLSEFASLEEMAAEYVTALRAVQPEGPYHLGGYCFGGNVAFEMARQLDAAGREVGVVALINSVPANCAYDRMRATPVNLWKFVRNLAYWAVQLSTSRTARTSELLGWKWRTLARKIVRRCGFDGADRELHLQDLVELANLANPTHAARWTAHLRAFYRYRPGTWRGRVLLLRTRGHQMFCTFAPDYGWSEFARGGVDIRVLGGEHESILEEPHVAATAHELGRALLDYDARRCPLALAARNERRRLARRARFHAPNLISESPHCSAAV